MLPTMDAALAVSFVENIRAEISELVFEVGQERIQIHISAGVAAVDSSGNVDQLLAQAEAALHTARSEKGNSVLLFRPGMEAPPHKMRWTRTDQAGRDSWSGSRE